MAVVEWIEIYRQILPFVILAITAGLLVWVFLKKARQAVKPAVFLIIFLKGVEAIALSAGIYWLWKNNPISKFLLPPYQPIGYFVQYAGYRFILPFIFSLIIAAAFFWAAKLLDKKRERKFFENREYWFLFFGIFVAGQPLWIVYLAAVLIIGVLGYLGRLIFNKVVPHAPRQRGALRDKFSAFRQKFIFPLYYLWLPVLFFVLLFSRWLLKLPLISELKF